jgi:hypothetical protein
VITVITDHRNNPDFVFNTLDRIKKYPSTFLKKQFDHFSTSLNPFELLAWTDSLADIIDDTWDLRCEVAHFHNTPLLYKKGLRTHRPYMDGILYNLPVYWEIITLLINIVLLR